MKVLPIIVYLTVEDDVSCIRRSPVSLSCRLEYATGNSAVYGQVVSGEGVHVDDVGGQFVVLNIDEISLDIEGAGQALNLQSC